MSFVRRAITVQFTLLNGSFNGQSGNTVTVSGLRVRAVVSKSGGDGMFTADVRIYGMTPALMNQLSTLGKFPQQERGNTITILAGDYGATLPKVYSGNISQAWIDYSAAPEVCFIVQAFTGMNSAMAPLPPTSYATTVDVAVAMSTLAQQMGYTFENNGVSVLLATPYWAGTGWTQAHDMAHAAHINLALDDDTLAIWPWDGARSVNIPLISSTTGLVGYPSYTQGGIDVTSIFNPNIKAGGKIQVQSSIVQACGFWPVFSLVHDLESESPDGAWFSHAECSLFGFANSLTTNRGQ